MATTITQALTRDHKVAMADVLRALGNPRTIPTIYPKIADEIRRHSKAEESTLYAALGQIPTEVATVESLEAGHAQIGVLLDGLDRTNYGDPRFLQNLGLVQRLLANHVRFEETIVFPYTQRILPLARQIALGQRYDERMGMRAPKRNISLSTSTPNPCGCVGTNPPAKPRRRWYHHMLGGLGTLIR